MPTGFDGFRASARLCAAALLTVLVAPGAATAQVVFEKVYPERSWEQLRAGARDGIAIDDLSRWLAQHGRVAYRLPERRYRTPSLMALVVGPDGEVVGRQRLDPNDDFLDPNDDFLDPNDNFLRLLTGSIGADLLVPAGMHVTNRVAVRSESHAHAAAVDHGRRAIHDAARQGVRAHALVLFAVPSGERLDDPTQVGMTVFTWSAAPPRGRRAPVARPRPPRPPAPPAPREDCVPLPADLALHRVGEQWRLTDGTGSRWIKMFDEVSEARQAFSTIRHYGMDSLCFVGRPGPSVEYLLVGGQAPQGALRGEDCIAFDPASLQVRPDGNRWLLTDGRSRMKVFDDRDEADLTLAIIRHHGFTRTCYIGRPQPSMTYFRR
jgi:hypothetical protein